MAEGIVLKRRLRAGRTGGLTMLDVLRWPIPLGQAVRLTFGRGTSPEMLAPVQEALTVNDIKQSPFGMIVSGRLPADADAFDLALLNSRITLSPDAPESHLFADLDCLLAQRHGETAAQVADWLAWHVQHFGAQALLLFDRANPDKAAFADELAELTRGMSGLRRLVVVCADVPLGDGLKPPLGDPGTAPRTNIAPGAPDPWTAPLGEPLLYDVLKWRFLGRAAGVLALDPCDFLDLSPEDVNCFAFARGSNTGFVPVHGRCAFAWRIRRGREAHPGDHICTANPEMRAPTRWLVAPSRLDPAALWTVGKPRDVVATADDTLRYTRGMNLTFAGSDTSDLIDKKTLRENAGLLARAVDVLGYDPVRPPERHAMPLVARRPSPTGRRVVVTCMKNEGPFILEWLAYHRMIGIDDVLVYTNDCQDGTVELLDLLAARGLVQRRDNPFRETGAKPQNAALSAAWEEAVVRNAGWLVSMDVDEFLNIHVGAGHLDDLFGAVPNADAISATWRLFGNGGVSDFADVPVTGQFTRCAPHLIRRPHQAWGFKTLFRNNGLFEGMGVHRPRKFVGQSALWVNGSGQAMPPQILKTGWRSGIDTYGYDLVTLNHYSVRSAESFLVKRDRGRVNHVARDQGLTYWFRMNNNAQVDHSIQRHLPALEKAIAALKSDPEIATAHTECVAWHRARIRYLKHVPEFDNIFKEITGPRLQILSQRHKHLGMNVFLQGPGVIPDRLCAPDLPPDYFFNVEKPDP